MIISMLGEELELSSEEIYVLVKPPVFQQRVHNNQERFVVYIAKKATKYMWAVLKRLGED